MTSKRKLPINDRVLPDDPFHGSHIWTILPDNMPMELNEDGRRVTFTMLAEHAKAHFGRQAEKFSDKTLIAFFILSRVLFNDHAELYHIAFRDWLFKCDQAYWGWHIGVELVCTFLRNTAYDVHIRPHLMWEEVKGYFRD